MVFPLIVKSAAQKVSEQFKQSQNNYQDKRAEGEIRIDKFPTNKSNKTEKEGEYTDFTEV